MDRSRFIPINEIASNPEVRKFGCDNCMVEKNDFDKIGCDKYYLHPRIKSYIHIFTQKQIECLFFKRDGRCCLANLMD